MQVVGGLDLGEACDAELRVDVTIVPVDDLVGGRDGVGGEERGGRAGRLAVKDHPELVGGDDSALVEDGGGDVVSDGVPLHNVESVGRFVVLDVHEAARDVPDDDAPAPDKQLAGRRRKPIELAMQMMVRLPKS